MVIMKWNKLESEKTLQEIIESSDDQAVVIFKHSTRCPISTMALSWFEKSWKDEEMKDVRPYYLDLINYRSISNKIAEEFDVQHESPQLLLIQNGQCGYHTSHSNISYKELQKKLGK